MISVQERRGSLSTAYFRQCRPSQYSTEWSSDDYPPHAYGDDKIWPIYRKIIVADGIRPFLLEVFSSEIVVNNPSGPDVLSPRVIENIQVAGTQNPDLRDALCDLDQAKDEAREEDFPVPSDRALKNARRLLHAIYKVLPWRFEVYPTPDGEIAIDVPGGFGRSVILLCDSGGGALCSVNMDGAHRRAHYEDVHMLPDGFVREALIELDRRDERAHEIT